MTNKKDSLDKALAEVIDQFSEEAIEGINNRLLLICISKKLPVPHYFNAMGRIIDRFLCVMWETKTANDIRMHNRKNPQEKFIFDEAELIKFEIEFLNILIGSREKDLESERLKNIVVAKPRKTWEDLV